MILFLCKCKYTLIFSIFHMSWLIILNIHYHCIDCRYRQSKKLVGKGNGTPLQYSSLENPHGQRSLVDYSPWSCKELDITEQLSKALLGYSLQLRL